MSLQIGSRIGPYEVLGAIGAGGMGEVYRAVDTRLNRHVAIKVLPQAFARDAEWLERFQREARAVAALSHPNILAIHDLGEVEGAPYAVMELLDGETLRTRIDNGPQPVRRVLALASQIARGLAAAHEQGIIHRDIKPENIFVTRDGRVKILDFGLARQLNAPADVTGAVTVAGTVMGTVGYMAPEQVRGLPSDARCDVFAFGAVLYELLTGRRAFARESAAETMSAIVRDDPPPLEAAALPPALERIVWRCLEKDPAARFQSCHDLAFALENAGAESSSGRQAIGGAAVTAATRRPHSRVAWLAAASLVGAALGAAAMWMALSSGRAPQQGAATRRAALQVTGLGDIRNSSTSSIAISEDGTLLVYGTPPGVAGGQLHVRRLDSLESKAVEGTAGAQAAFLSYDGTMLGFQREGEIFTVPTAGGAPTQIRNSAYLAEGRPSWTRDGRIVFTAASGELSITAPDGTPERLTTAGRGERHLSPHPLPDGRTILFTATLSDVATARIAAVSVGDRQVRAVLDGAMTPQFADGYLLYVRPDSSLAAVRFDPDRLRVSGGPISLPDRVSRTRFGVGHYAAVAGTIVYVPAARTRLVEVFRDGRRETLVDEERNWHHPRYSPDGTRIVLDVTTGGTERDVWVFDRRLKTLSRVTRIGDAHDPVWVPGGTSVSFFSFKSPGGPLMVAGADGGADPQAVRVDAGFSPADLVNPGAWMPDGSAYVGSVRSGGAPGDVWSVPRAGGTPTKLFGSSYDELAPAISPDARWLAYQSDETGRMEVYVRPLTGAQRRVQVSSAGGAEVAWDPAGTVLYYVEPSGVRRQLVAATLRTAPDLAVAARAIIVQDLRHEESDNHANYDVHPSEPRFVIPEVEVRSGLVAIFDWVASLPRR